MRIEAAHRCVEEARLNSEDANSITRMTYKVVVVLTVRYFSFRTEIGVARCVALLLFKNQIEKSEL